MCQQILDMLRQHVGFKASKTGEGKPAKDPLASTTVAVLYRAIRFASVRATLWPKTLLVMDRQNTVN